MAAAPSSGYQIRRFAEALVSAAPALIARHRDARGERPLHPRPRHLFLHHARRLFHQGGIAGGAHPDVVRENDRAIHVVVAMHRIYRRIAAGFSAAFSAPRTGIPRRTSTTLWHRSAAGCGRHRSGRSRESTSVYRIYPSAHRLPLASSGRSFPPASFAPASPRPAVHTSSPARPMRRRTKEKCTRQSPSRPARRSHDRGACRRLYRFVP